jgi:hypothetical protein
MKVEVQYEVLGWRSERVTRLPDGTIDWLLVLAKPYVKDEEPYVSVVPTAMSIFLDHFPALRTGLHQVPYGTLLRAYIPSRYVDVH